MPELSGNNMFTGGNMGTGVNSQTLGSGFSFGTGNNLGSGTSYSTGFGGGLGTGSYGTYGTGSTVGTGYDAPKQSNNDFAYTGLNESQINWVNEQAYKKMEEKGLTGDVALYAELEEAYNAALDIKQRKEQKDNSIAQTRALIEASYRANDPKLKQQYNSTARIQSLGTAIKLWGESQGQDYSQYSDDDLILNLVANNGNDKLINQYIGGKVKLPDLLTQLGMAGQAKKEQERIDRENAIKEQERLKAEQPGAISNFVNNFVNSYVFEPVKEVWDGSENIFGKIMEWTAFTDEQRDYGPLREYIKDNYGVAPYELTPEQLEELDATVGQNPDLLEPYRAKLADGIAQTTMGVTDAYFKYAAPLFMAFMTAIGQSEYVSQPMEVINGGLGTILNALPGFYQFSEQLSPEVRDQWKQYLGGLGFAKILSKFGARNEGKAGAKTFSKEWFKQNFNPKQIVEDFADRYEPWIRTEGMNIVKSTIDGYKKGGVMGGIMGAGEGIVNAGLDTISDSATAVKNAAVDATWGNVKKAGGKVIKSWQELQQKYKLNPDDTIMNNIKDLAKGKIEESPEAMNWIKEQSEKGNPNFNAGARIQNQFKFSDKFLKKFEQTTGKKVGDYLNDEGLYGGENKADTYNKLEERFKGNLEHLDEAFSKIEGTYKDDYITEMAYEVAKDAKESFGAKSPEKAKYMQLLTKAMDEGLTPAEIREVKQYFERHNTMDYQRLGEQGYGQKYRKAIDIDSNVRKFMYKILEEEYNFKEAPQIAKEIQASKMILDELGKEGLGKYADLKGLSMTDVISLANGSLLSYFYKEALNEAKAPSTNSRIVDLINKANGHTTKEATRGDIGDIVRENFKKENIEKPMSEDQSKMKLEDKGADTYEGINSILFGADDIIAQYPHLASHDYVDYIIDGEKIGVPTTITKEGGLQTNQTQYNKWDKSTQEPEIIDMSKDLNKNIDIGKDNIVEIIDSDAYTKKVNAEKARKAVQAYNEAKLRENIKNLMDNPIVKGFYKDRGIEQKGLFD